MFGSNKQLIQVPPNDEQTMKGAGIAYKGRRFITHTTLPNEETAFFNLTAFQKLVISTLFAAAIYFLLKSPLNAIVSFLGFLSLIYFIDVVFHLFLIVKSLENDYEIKISDEGLAEIEDEYLPVYTILCPLYKEAKVVPKFIRAIEKLDWPKNKLDVILLLEEDDTETQSTIAKLGLPSYFRAGIVPFSEPKTKPKACNWGLAMARGEFLVIYDAEDEPEPMQLKKAYLGFQNVEQDVICLQAKLNYYNSQQNLLTRLFTAEYSLWFDVILPGLQMMETMIPLGGTSNHFKKNDLVRLKGWDAFNVTEDADLGVRLFKAGYKTAIIDSVTLEEANSALGNWIRQRSRWIKGYIQTYFVNMRNPVAFFKDYGNNALIFQLLMGGKIAFSFINPILWVMTIAYFAAYSFAGPFIEAVYPPRIFYLALVSLVIGNVMFFYVYMVGCAKRLQWPILKYLFLLPVYWLLTTIAAFVALYQFIVKPHYWEKTIHGLDKEKTISQKAWEAA